MLHHKEVFYSPGGSVRYEVIGPVCRLFDREELPYPSCNLQWKGKQPSWNRIGRRFIPDLSASRCESYSVRVLGYDNERVFSFFHRKLDYEKLAWWFTTDRKRAKYVSESHIYDGHSESSSIFTCVWEANSNGRGQECLVHGN